VIVTKTITRKEALMRQFKHIQDSEREVIQKMLYSQKKYSLEDIASILDRAPSTISREIERDSTHGYNAREAGEKAKERRKAAKKKAASFGCREQN